MGVKEASDVFCGGDKSLWQSPQSRAHGAFDATQRVNVEQAAAWCLEN